MSEANSVSNTVTESPPATLKDQRVAAARAKHGADVELYWIVHRIAENGQEAFVEQVRNAEEEFDEAAFAARHPAGHYHRRLRAAGNRGNLADEKFLIAERVQAGTPATSPAPAPAPSGDFVTRRDLEDLVRRMTPAGESGFGFREIVTLMMQQAQAQQAATTSLLTSLIQGQQRTPVSDLVELMGIMDKRAGSSDGDAALVNALAPAIEAFARGGGFPAPMQQQQRPQQPAKRPAAPASPAAPAAATTAQHADAGVAMLRMIGGLVEANAGTVIEDDEDTRRNAAGQTAEVLAPYLAAQIPNARTWFASIEEGALSAAIINATPSLEAHRPFVLLVEAELRAIGQQATAEEGGES